MYGQFATPHKSFFYIFFQVSAISASSNSSARIGQGGCKFSFRCNRLKVLVTVPSDITFISQELLNIMESIADVLESNWLFEP